MDEYQFAIESFLAGIAASVACGLGALPLAVRRLDIGSRIGLAYAFAGGLMFAASFYNLLMPALELGSRSATKLAPIALTTIGLLAGAGVMFGVQRWLAHQEKGGAWSKWLGGQTSLLVFIAMTVHSIPEGVAVGVGYGAEGSDPALGELGGLIALAIAIHNIPEGLAVSLPMRAGGASIARCFFAAFLTSLPQPIAAVPASLMVWFFHPLMLPMLGFAAGAMIYLVVVELIPDALETRSPTQTAWAFMLGFAAMAAVQAAL